MDYSFAGDRSGAESTTSRSSAIDDVCFLTRADHRVDVLEAVRAGPRTRADLQSATGVSRSTIGRTIREFEDRRWIRKRGDRYEATQLGAYVAAGLRELIDLVATEQILRDVWEQLPPDADRIPIETLSDAVVTKGSVGDPYRPVSRFRSLLADTTEFRFVGFELGLLEPCKDELCDRIVDGLRAEIIDPPQVATYIRQTYPDRSAETLRSGNLTVLLCEDVPPYGLALFDERIGICTYTPGTGTVQALVDTGSESARDWAESTYDQYRRLATPLSIESAPEGPASTDHQ